jgi:hypothetical protein
VHVHGVANHIAPPAPLVESHPRGLLATTLALSVAAAACNNGCAAAPPAEIEVRAAPPSVSVPPPPTAPSPATPDAGKPVPK